MPLLAHHPSLPIAFKRTDPAPHLGTIVMPILLVGTQVSLLWVFVSGTASPTPRVCHVMVRKRERCPPTPWHLQQMREIEWESEPCNLPGEHSRADSIDGGVGGWPQEYECERPSSTPHLLYGGMGKGEKTTSCPSRPMVGGRATRERAVYYLSPTKQSAFCLSTTW